MKKFLEKLLNFLLYGVYGVILFAFAYTHTQNYLRIQEIEAQQNELYFAQANYFYNIMEVMKLLQETSEQGDQILLTLLNDLEDFCKRNHDSLVDVINENNKKIEEHHNSLVNTVNTNATRTDENFKLFSDTLDERTKRVDYKYLKERTVIINQKFPHSDRVYLGTGVIVKIDEDYTYILTNKHVISECDQGWECVTFDDTQERPIEIVKKSAFEFDMAVVKVEGKLKGKKAFEVISAPVIQERVYMVGHNLGRLYLYAQGYVAGHDNQLQKSLVVGIPSGPGNSGSGVVNSKGELIGLVWGGRLIPHFPFETFDTASALCVDGKVIKLFLEGALNDSL